MKNKLHNRISIINLITNRDKFKLIFFLTILLSLYASFILGGDPILGLIEASLNAFQFSSFQLVFFGLLFFNTYHTCSIIMKFDSYTIRFQCKKKYLKELLKTIIYMNLLYMIIFFLFYFMFLILIKFGTVSFSSYYHYSINQVVYLVYYIIRMITFSIFFSLFPVFFYYKEKEKLSLIYIGIFLVLLLTAYTSFQQLKIFQILPSSYFGFSIYSSFLLDVSYSLLYLLILEILCYIGFYILTRKKSLKEKPVKKKTFKSKHLFVFYNDLVYLYKKRTLLIGVIFALTFVNLILRYHPSKSTLDIFHYVMGTNIEATGFGILETLSYIFQIALFIFLTIELYLKDLKNHVDFIFVRMKSCSWFKQKFILLNSFFIGIKILQYLIAIIFVLCKGNFQFSEELCLLFITDTFYILLVANFFFLIYLLYYVFPKLRWLVILFGIIFAIFIPKSIYDLSNNILMLFASVIIGFIIMYLLFKKKSKTILQVVREI